MFFPTDTCVRSTTPKYWVLNREKQFPNQFGSPLYPDESELLDDKYWARAAATFVH
ncbi:hypothetical protein SAMN05660226_03166 [Parapedobacter luteus]|uniref:Uncharacterized protein n=1 Tax=Parapedobacter luteus TaxID=623280 RepID=A0A1T5E573_9SPHI|nr:hypothetical protein SAMN05660226_03166 [Parapedobacter luteus]